MTSQALDFESNNNRIFLTWTNVKPYLDGTLATLKFHYIEYSSKYVIITEKYGTFSYFCTVLRDAGADVTDFETNFQPLAIRNPVPLPVEGESVVSGGSADNTANSTSKVPVIAAKANASAPSWTEGNMVPLSVDNAGALRISGSISATNPSVSTTGSAPPASATYIGGSVTTSAPSYTNGYMAALSLDTSGALRVSGTTATTNLSVGSTGAAILAYATNLAASDGTNLVQLSALSSAPSGSEYGLIVRNIPYGTQAISVASLPLPTGAATSALQTTGNSSLSNIDTKTPALGQATMANSSPVVIASDQSAVPVSDAGGSLTVDGSVSVSNFPAVQSVDDNGGSLTIDDGGGAITVDGTVTANQGGAPWSNRIQDGSGSNLLAINGSGQAAIQNPPNLDVAASTLATEATLDSIKDTDGIKKITDALPVGNNRIGKIKLVDDNDARLDLARDTAIPSGSRGLLSLGQDSVGDAQAIHVEVDPLDSKRRLQIEGKVSISPPAAPPSTTKVTINASSPLSISSTTTSTYVITNAKTFYIQQVACGSEGDSSEKGSVLEVYYYDGTTEHIVERVYVNGFTQYGIFPDTNTARDGTAMTGNGTTKEIRVRRRRLSGASQEVDAVVRGYEA